jgi:hypothetical protein
MPEFSLANIAPPPPAPFSDEPTLFLTNEQFSQFNTEFLFM